MSLKRASSGWQSSVSTSEAEKRQGKWIIGVYTDQITSFMQMPQRHKWVCKDGKGGFFKKIGQGCKLFNFLINSMEQVYC